MWGSKTSENASYEWWLSIPCLVSGRLLLRWDICSITVTPFSKSFFIPGLYSGIFVLHLQIHAKEADCRTKNIVFQALWVLYLCSAAAISLDIANFVALSVSEKWASSFLNVVLINFAEPWFQYDSPSWFCSDYSIWFLWLHCSIYSCTHNYPFNWFI
jgi:hypothetical protein